MRAVVRTMNEAINALRDWEPDGKPYHLEVRPFKRPKSAEQRAKFHVLCREFAIKLRDEHGVDTSPDGVKYYIKEKYGPSRPYVGPNGRSRAMLISSEDWNVEQASEMIECVYREAAENGVELK